MAKRGRARLGASVVVIISGSLMALSAISGASVRVHPAVASTASPLAKGLAFYRGKTLTEIDPASIGTNIDVCARAIAAPMAAYLHASINIEDVPIGNQIPGDDDAANATPNGLTFGVLAPPPVITNLLTTGQTGLNFNPEREAFLGQWGGTISVFVAAPNSPFKTFGDLKSSPTPPSVLATAAGAGYITPRVTLGVLGIRASFISGFANPNAEVAGFLDGDGQVMETSFASLEPIIAAGKATPLLILAPPGAKLPAASRQYFKGVPTFSEYAGQHVPKSVKVAQAIAADATMTSDGDDIFTQSKVAGPQLAALRAALKFALENTQVRSTEVAEGIVPEYVDAFQAKQSFIGILKASKVMQAYA